MIPESSSSNTDPSGVQKISFSMTNIALKLLGQNLYSHPWSAISELVANGIDAAATNVYVHLDITDGNESAVLEILDDGVGMNREQLETYVLVGYNKRAASNRAPTTLPMGRKGIGKLAALYLSSQYEILTKTKKSGDKSRWSVDISSNDDDNSVPSLTSLNPEDATRSFLQRKWKQQKSGTLISITSIDLRHFGREAFKSLETRLANQFSLTRHSPVRILFACTENGEDPEFLPVQKSVASGNFLSLLYSSDDVLQVFGGISEFRDKTVDIEVARERYNADVRVDVMTAADQQGKAENEPLPLKGILTEEWLPQLRGSIESEIQYELSGWMGMHASIRTEIAQSNDERYRRNRFYNPSQVRLYVRGKLAVENILPLVGSTQTYANYIEGELHFDVLDDDRLPDIATTSREGFDESDPRIVLLKKLVGHQVRQLINHRNRLNEQYREEKSARQKRANQVAIEYMESKFSGLSIGEDELARLNDELSRQLGSSDIFTKDEYKIFISHAGKDKLFSDLVYQILLEKGVREDEVFYTSKDMSSIPSKANVKALSEQIHECITSVNTKILYSVGENFQESTFCLFEAGAGWATRGIGEYHIMATRYEAVPEWLHQGIPIVPNVDSHGNLILTRQAYGHLLGVLNELIEHVNKGRRISQQDEVSSFSPQEIPTDLSLQSSGDDISQYFDELIVRVHTAVSERWSPGVSQND